MKIVIADDHPLYLEGLANLLQLSDGFKLVGTAGNGEEAVTLALNKNPDLVLMDNQIPFLNGIEATRKIKKACLK